MSMVIYDFWPYMTDFPGVTGSVTFASRGKRKVTNSSCRLRLTLAQSKILSECFINRWYCCWGAFALMGTPCRSKQLWSVDIKPAHAGTQCACEDLITKAAAEEGSRKIRQQSPAKPTRGRTTPSYSQEDRPDIHRVGQRHHIVIKRNLPKNTHFEAL